MSRLILLTVAVLVFVWLLRRALAGRKSHKGPGRTGRPDRPDFPPPELVACAHCGVHLPKNEAVASRDPDATASGPYFCSEDHMRQGPG